MGIIFTIKLTYQASQTDENGIHDAFMDRADFDAKERQAFMYACQILHVARETIEGFNDYDIKSVVSCAIH